MKIWAVGAFFWARRRTALFRGMFRGMFALQANFAFALIVTTDGRNPLYHVENRHSDNSLIVTKFQRPKTTFSAPAKWKSMLALSKAERLRNQFLEGPK